MGMLVADRVFDEVGLVFFDQPAGADRVGVVETLVEVDAPVAIRSDALADFLAVLRDLADPLMSVEDPADRVSPAPMRKAR